jgi:hypothetical protein
MQDNYVLILYVKKWFDCSALGQVGRCENFMFFFSSLSSVPQGKLEQQSECTKGFLPEYCSILGTFEQLLN